MPTSTSTHYDYKQLRQLWLNAGGNKAWSYVMAAVGLAESSGVTYATNHDANGSVDYGLWQINSVHGYDANRLLSDPAYNAKAAVAVFNSSGPHAWSTYNNGDYKKYLPNGRGDPKINWDIFKSKSSVDQGVDFLGAGTIPALDQATVTDVGSVHIIEGGSWPAVIYHLTGGPEKGKYVYTMENFTPSVKKGQKLQRGDPIGTAKGQSPYIETGFNRQATGVNPIAPLYPNPHSPKQAGLEMQSYIKSDVSQGGFLSGIGGDVTTALNDANPLNLVNDAGSAVGSAITSAFSGMFKGFEAFAYQALFVIIGLGLVMVGLAIVVYTLMGKTGVSAPGIVGMVQQQQRINQGAARTAESQRASQVREGQAARRISEQRQSRKLSERRLSLQEGNAERRQERYVVKDKPNQVVRKKEGQRASGAPR